MRSRRRNELVSFVQKAKAFYETAGKEIALAEYNNPEGHFVQKQKYVYVLDVTGIMLAHGINERFVGKNFMGLKDRDGKAFIQEIVHAAETQPSGWVEYKWNHPVKKKELPKTVYWEKVNGMIICSGDYKEIDEPPVLDLL